MGAGGHWKFSKNAQKGTRIAVVWEFCRGISLACGGNINKVTSLGYCLHLINKMLWILIKLLWKTLSVSGLTGLSMMSILFLGLPTEDSFLIHISENY